MDFEEPNKKQTKKAGNGKKRSPAVSTSESTSDMPLTEPTSKSKSIPRAKAGIASTSKASKTPASKASTTSASKASTSPAKKAGKKATASKASTSPAKKAIATPASEAIDTPASKATVSNAGIVPARRPGRPSTKAPLEGEQQTPEQIAQQLLEEERKRLEREKIEKEELAKLSQVDLHRWQTLDYPLATRIVKRDIASFPHGAIRSMCSTYKLTYHTVIGLLNETITFEAPKLVLDLLYALEYEVKLTMEITPTGQGIRQYQEEYYYTLRKKGAR